MDAGARFATVVLAVVSGIGLFLLQQGIDDKWALLDSPARRLLALTALTVVPLLVALLLRRRRERAPWLTGLLYLLLLTPLAWHTGNAVVPDLSYEGDIYFLYWPALAAASFLLAPFLQARRSHAATFHYPALFEHACNNALTLLVAAAFVIACGLVLLLWQALFAVIGIHFFRELFKQPEFFYPETGLVCGLGLVIGRSQIGAVRTTLNICLMLGRALFPVVAVLALVFLGTALFSQLEALWQTRHASALLLTLLFALVALYNAVYQDGRQSAGYTGPLRLLANAALLVLPVYAGLAAYSLWLRVAQHGWTEERLWGCVIDLVAALYAMAYAAAVLQGRDNRLPLLQWANPRIAMAVMMILLLTQSPLLDFRAISVRAQVAEALSPGHDPQRLDLHYLRFQAGRPGNEALQSLQADPRLDPALKTDIAAMLKQTSPYQAPRPETVEVDEQTFRILPEGTPLPASLLNAVRWHKPNDGGRPAVLAACARAKGSCLLLNVELGQGLSWVEFDTCLACGGRVYRQDAGGWVFAGHLRGSRGINLEAQGRAALMAHSYRAETPPWKDLILGDKLRLHFEPAPDPQPPVPAPAAR